MTSRAAERRLATNNVEDTATITTIVVVMASSRLYGWSKTSFRSIKTSAALAGFVSPEAADDAEAGE